MFTLVDIATDSVHYAAVEELMLSAFPPEERREVMQQRQVAGVRPEFRCRVALREGTMAGFVTTWDFDTFLYVEHLAVCERLRGQGVGASILRQLQAEGRPIVLEVEPPTEYPDGIDIEKNNEKANDSLAVPRSIAARRVAFYQRLGFCLWAGSAYLQPPYAPGKPAVPLLLMAWGGLDERRHFPAVERTLHSRVYGVDW